MMRVLPVTNPRNDAGQGQGHQVTSQCRVCVRQCQHLYSVNVISIVALYDFVRCLQTTNYV